MRPIKWAAAGLAGLAITACGGGDAPMAEDAVPSATSAYDTILADVPRLDGSAAFDIELARAILPEGTALTYASMDHDAASGRTRFTDVSLQPSSDSDIAFIADEVDIWGADLEFLLARMAGERLDETGSVLTRLDARGLEIAGLETLYTPLIEPYNETLQDIIEVTPGEDLPDVTMAFDTYDIDAGRMVLTGLVLHPYTAPTRREDGEAADLEPLQDMAAIMRAFSIDAAILTDMSIDLAYTQMDQQTTMTMTAPFSGYRGLSRGDITAMDFTDMAFSMDMALPDMATPGLAGAMQTMVMAGEIASYSITDMRFGALLDYAIAGTAPPTSATELLSLGHYAVEGVNYTLDGAPFMQAESMVFDATRFHWLIPTDLSFDLDGFVYDYSAYLPLFEATMGEEFAEYAEEIDQSVEILQRYDLLGPSADIDFNWNWTPEGGDIAMTYDQVTGGHGALDFDFRIDIPAWSRWAHEMTLNEEDDDPEREARMEELFQTESAFHYLTARYTDTGGLDRVFDAIIEIADILPQDNPQIEAFAQYDKATLKTMLTGTMLMGINEVAREFPPARKWGNAVVAFVQDGGEIAFLLEPEVPITFAAIEAIDDQYDGDPPPQLIVETFGINVEHTPHE